MATIELTGGASLAAAEYGQLAASEAFLLRRKIVAWVVRIILFLAAALSVFVTASIVYILVGISAIGLVPRGVSPASSPALTER